MTPGMFIIIYYNVSLNCKELYHQIFMRGPDSLAHKTTETYV